MTEQQPFTYQPPTPFSASFEGYTANPDDLEQWPNTVTVEVVDHYDAAFNGEVTASDEIYADIGAGRYLVEVDTNYKPGRPGQHPVRLTRADAVKFASAVLRATGDTFDYRRCGQLRPAEAAELLRALREVEVELGEIREHALADLLDGTRLGDDQATIDVETAVNDPHTHVTPPAVPGPANQPTPAVGDVGEALAWALFTLFPSTAEVIKDSDAYGALSYKVSRRCQEIGETPREVLDALDREDRVFAATRADDPAAFLASRIDS
jgi:hypothetical protein